MSRHLCALGALITLLSASPALSLAETAPELTSASLLKAAEGRIPQFLGCIRQNGGLVLGAHRGGALPEYPENAIATMARTTEMAPVFIETDVQESRDGVLFMNHDPFLERNTTGEGLVADHDWAAISQLKQRDPTAQPTSYTPPHLMDVLKWSHGRALLLLDVKPSTNVEKVITEVEAAGAQGRVMYLAYTVEQAQRTLKRAPSAVIALPMLNRDYFQRMQAAGLTGGNILGMVNVVTADPQLINDIRATGTIVLSGSYGNINSPDSLYRTVANADVYHAMTTKGADMIASNRPVEAGQALMSQAEYAQRINSCAMN